MSVSLKRYIFRRIGGKIIPIRIGASQLPKALIQIPPPQKLQDHFEIGRKIKDAAIFLQRKGSELTVGAVRKLMEHEDIAIKVKDATKIDSTFAKYAFQNLHNMGFWRNKAHGTLPLKNLRISAVKSTSIEDLFPMMKNQRKQVEEALKKMPSGTSRKALIKLNALNKIKKANIPKK